MLEWPLRSNITELAYKYNLAVIAPSGENRWYVDHTGEDEKYGRFTGEELVAITRKMFALSDRREDTLISGFSMGGFGAIMNGFEDLAVRLALVGRLYQIDLYVYVGK